jgi:hypothetical protein
MFNIPTMVQTRSGRMTGMTKIRKGDCSECDEFTATFYSLIIQPTSSVAKTLITNIYCFLMHMKSNNHVKTRGNQGIMCHRLHLALVSKLNEFKQPKYKIVEFCEHYLNLIEQNYKVPDDYNKCIKELMQWICYDRKIIRHEIVDNILCEYVVGVPLREL